MDRTIQKMYFWYQKVDQAYIFTSDMAAESYLKKKK